MINLALINELIGLPPNASEHGYQIDHIIEFCHWFMGALFVGWSVYFVYVLLRFRKGRHPTADHEGVKNAISTHLEFSVVLIEAVLLLAFAVPLWAKRVNEFPKTKMQSWYMWSVNSLTGTFIFPDRMGNLVAAKAISSRNSNPVGLDLNDPASKDDLVVLGELHLPVNRPVIMELASKDVIHNFAMPNMRMAQDAIPGQVIPMWFKPIKTGNI